MDRILKKVQIVVVFLVILFLNLIFILIKNNTSFAIDTYYTGKKETLISEGVTQIDEKLLTSKGIVDVNIIKVDLLQKNLKFENLYNDEQIGNKTTLTNLVAQRDKVVAAVNGDFFEMSLSPSFPLGIVVNDGKLESMTTGEYYNYYSNSLATLFLTKDNNPIIDYVRYVATFSNEEDTLYLSYINKIGDKEGTVYLSGEFFSSSADMDARNPNIYKIVVKNSKITKIVEPGTSVDINKDEYVICLPSNFERIDNFHVGDKVTYNVENTWSSNIVTAIGGAGRILKNGQMVNDGYIITGNTSRSFVGYNNSYLFFGTVGGKTSTNVGITHEDLANILLNFGITNAMHLDGGGSSELVSKSEYDSNLSIANGVTSQRAIVNSLALINTASTTKIDGIKINLSSDKLIKNSKSNFEVIAYNKYHERVDIDTKDVEFYCDDAIIDEKHNIILFENEGRFTLTAKYKSFETSIDIDVYDSITEVIILPDPINLDVDGECDLKIYALTEEKYKIPLDTDECDFIVSPSNIAKVKNGKVIGLREGVGTIGVSFNDLEAYSVLSIGYEDKIIENFSYNTFESINYPDNVESSFNNDNGKLHLTYSFDKSNESQAAYIKFNENKIIPKNAKTLKIDIKGDKSNNLLKAKLVDDNNESYLISICDDIDFKSTKTYEVELPYSYSGNLYVERLYVVSLESKKAIKLEIVLDDLRCQVPYDYSTIEVPKSVIKKTRFKDETIESINEDDMLFINNSISNTLLSNYLDMKIAKSVNEFDDVDLILARNTDRLTGKRCYGEFSGKEYEQAFVCSLSTINGSTYAKDPYQYIRLENLLNELDDNISNVIITLDYDLTNGKYPTDKAMLEYVLNKFYQKKRVNFYVVSFTNSKSNEKISNGIKYLNVSSNLKDAFEDNILVLRMKDNNLNTTNEMTYNFVSIAELINTCKE